MAKKKMRIFLVPWGFMYWF